MPTVKLRIAVDPLTDHVTIPVLSAAFADRSAPAAQSAAKAAARTFAFREFRVCIFHLSCFVARSILNRLAPLEAVAVFAPLKGRLQRVANVFSFDMPVDVQEVGLAQV